jgi:hypothetical protein
VRLVPCAVVVIGKSRDRNPPGAQYGGKHKYWSWLCWHSNNHSVVVLYFLSAVAAVPPSSLSEQAVNELTAVLGASNRK